MQTDTPVLIVGAGPTGLAMATILHRYQIPFYLIDKKAERTKTSNALGLHARTLALLEDLALVDAFTARGKPAVGATMHANGKPFAQVDLKKINSIYPYVLIVPQSHTEQILEEHLLQQGVAVMRDTALTHLEKKADHYQVTIHKNGQDHQLTTQYIIAADGAHSTVRKLCKIDFTGREIPQQFILSDSTVSTTLSQNELQAFYGKNGLLAIFPLPNGEVRLIGDVPHAQKIGHDPADIAAAITTITEARTQGQVQVKQHSWVSTFWIHSKCIKEMRQDNIFFMGDAAHIHSPAGGQGMNTGMQDAYNLGWKLALCLQKKADKKILASFSQERHPVIRSIVKQTDALTRLLLANNLFSRFIRNAVMRPLLKTKCLNLKVATRLAMLNIHYPKSAIIHYLSSISGKSPQPGELVPEIKTLQPHHFTHYLNGKNHKLLIFCGKNPTPATLSEIQKVVAAINADYKELIDSCVVSKEAVQMAATWIKDADFQIHQRFNAERPALCLIRPDKYIAYCSANLNVAGLKNYLASIYSE